MCKFGRLAEELVETGLVASERDFWQPIEQVPLDMLHAVHDSGYVDRVLNRTLSEQETR